jgi:hypothetical protein
MSNPKMPRKVFEFWYGLESTQEKFLNLGRSLHLPLSKKEIFWEDFNLSLHPIVTKIGSYFYNLKTRRLKQISAQLSGSFQENNFNRYFLSKRVKFVLCK